MAVSSSYHNAKMLPLKPFSYIMSSQRLRLPKTDLFENRPVLGKRIPSTIRQVLSGDVLLQTY